MHGPAHVKDNDWCNDFLARQLYAGIVQLSGVYIKFGQLLSTRPDILPEIMTIRLLDLLEKVPAEPFSDSVLTIEQELGAGAVQTHFAAFGRQPLAAASFSTVYRARLHGGEDVVVKVQRRGVGGKSGAICCCCAAAGSGGRCLRPDEALPAAAFRR